MRLRTLGGKSWLGSTALSAARRTTLSGVLRDPGRHSSFKSSLVPMGAPAYVELNLAESNEGRFRASLDILESTPQHTLCLVDEADSKPEESWPYELLLRHLEPPEGRRKRVCFILAGSSGRSLEEMTTAIQQRPKGADLLSRIPADH